MEPRPAPDTAGDLRRSPVAQILWDLVARRFTGTLVVRATDPGPLQGESLYTFEDGSLTQSKLPQPLDTLGAVLHEQGSIDSAQLDASLMRLAAREGLQGEILVAMGACARATVEACLREQLRRKLLRLFGVVYGQFELHTDLDLLVGFGRERFPVLVLPLLWIGVRAHPRHLAVDAVIERLGANLLRVRRTSPARALFGDGVAERELLDRLTEAATVDDLLALNRSALLVRAVVYLLAMTRQIERATPSTGTSQPGIPAVPMRPASQPDVPAVTARPWETAVPAVAQRTPSQTGLPTFSTRTSSQTGLPTFSTRPSQTDLLAVPDASRVVQVPRGDGPVQRISTSNLPTVKGPSIAAVVREVQGTASTTQGNLRARVAEAEALLAAMEAQTAFEMLGVAPDADASAVAMAFRALALRWHPDASPASSPALREAHERIFALLSEAEATLSNDRLREAYLRDMAMGCGTPRSRSARSKRDTEIARAELALKQRSFAEAERAARSVIEDHTRDATALTILATALLELYPGGPYDEIRRCIIIACQKEPENDRAHVVAAQMYKRLGDDRRTLMHFIKAYKINPRNVDAVRELRIVAMRRREAGAVDQESAGFLAKLFGSK